MLTRPFTRLVVAFGIRRVTQRRLVEEVVLGILVLIPFGFVVGLFTSRLCTKVHIPAIRSDIWTTIVVFLIGDILMEWLLPSLSCLPMDNDMEDNGDNGVYHYTFHWVFQSFGLICPDDFASTESLLSPDATAVLFSVRLVFLCIGVHFGESMLCCIALSGGISTGKTTVGRLLVDCEVVETTDEDSDEQHHHDNDSNNEHNTNNTSNNNNENDNEFASSSSNPGLKHRKKSSSARGSGSSSSGGGGGGGGNKRGSGGGGGKSKKGRRGTTNGTGTSEDDVENDDHDNNQDNDNDDGYKEGTVHLICADTIAHEVILPPQILAAGRLSAALQNINNNDVVVRDGGEYGGNDNDDPEFIVQPQDSVYDDIVQAFDGYDILATEDGLFIDRLKLGSIIFQSKEQRKKLNSITHPRIFMVLIRKLVHSVLFGNTDLTVADVPLLYESGKLSWMFAATICVTIKDPALQLERLMERNPELSKEECQARIDSQMPLQKKEQLADIVIDNTGDLEELSRQVEDVRRDLMGRIYGIGMSLLQMLLLIGGSTSIAVSSKFYTNWQE